MSACGSYEYVFGLLSIQVQQPDKIASVTVSDVSLCFRCSFNALIKSCFHWFELGIEIYVLGFLFRGS